MPRTNLRSKESRAQLAARGEPYWMEIDRGLHLGYRKNKHRAAWCVRIRQDDRYLKRTIGDADDNAPADGVSVLNFTQARHAAEEYSRKASDEAVRMPKSRGYTVGDAAADYLDWYRLNRKAIDAVQSSIDAFILPVFANESIDALTTAQIKRWHQGMAKQPPRASGGRPKPPYCKKTWTGKRTKPKGHKIYRYETLPYSEWTDEMKRKRKSTANRHLTNLKALLNQAWRDENAASNAAWSKVKPFEGADAARVRYLTSEQARDLLAACTDEFRPMARAALETGARYGELTRLRVRHIEDDRIYIEPGKTGARHVPLSAAGLEFFKGLAKGKQPDDLLLTHADGSAWGKSHQTRPMRHACDKAGIKPAIGFHILRHTYATLLLSSEGGRGVSIRDVAELIGDSVATCEKHYGHVQEDALRKEVARKLPSFGEAA